MEGDSLPKGTSVLTSTSGGLLVLALLSATPAVAPAAERSDAGVEITRPSPVKSGVAHASGLRIQYTIHGDSSSRRLPILLLHGAYMTGDGMKPFVERFARTRQVIVFDQRGHGRTGDAPGPITYEKLADDAAAVLAAAGIPRADVLGYSMGGSAAIQLAVRHPTKVAKLVPVSAGTRLDAMYREIAEGIGQITPSVFDGTPIRREYDRLAPRPADFPKLVQKLKVLDATRPEHAVEMFRMRGGGASALAAQGILQAPPPARLLILPATSHIGIVAEADAIVSFVTPFLDDVTPAAPKGFF
jgi:hypothetical protein